MWGAAKVHPNEIQVIIILQYLQIYPFFWVGRSHKYSFFLNPVFWILMVRKWWISSSMLLVIVSEPLFTIFSTPDQCTNCLQRTKKFLRQSLWCYHWDFNQMCHPRSNHSCPQCYLISEKSQRRSCIFIRRWVAQVTWFHFNAIH